MSLAVFHHCLKAKGSRNLGIINPAKTMKKLLIPTDFSPAAHNAGRYALHLAQELKHGLILCHSWLSPTHATGAAQVAWRLIDDGTLKRDVADQLKAEA